LAGTRAQSGDQYCSGRLHSGQVLRGSLPLLSPIYIYYPLPPGENPIADNNNNNNNNNNINNNNNYYYYFAY
jgi:hypothetical protein